MKILVGLLIVLLSACSNLPETISRVPENNHQLRNVVNDVDNFIGQQVRWGGEIIKVSRDNNLSILEIKQFPLNRYGFPLTNVHSQGKFIARSDQLFDQEVYQEGLLITFSGMITSEIKETVKRKDNYLPIITITDSNLWPYRISKGRAYTNTSMESEFRGYGIEGSGHYQVY
ncbi:MAG: starvation-inducible protein [Gammaproteobacteria bacterium]|nr:MAG: starvation-inducible protein [Gammaproteobacteria bacterium]RKZ94031.1 MAG: starvation-inducible protein [Gammaproteobacteria bacterium]RKZ96547.1 MAG: starvation-inducible protein [Gammaproteobacteria bacterium]